jgi:hypothetical protein
MSAFDFKASVESFERRFEASKAGVARRPKRRRSRLDPEILAELARELSTRERPSIAAVVGRLAAFADARGLRAPARATVYALLDTLETPDYEIAALPEEVRATLFNLDPLGRVPGVQLAIAAFNHGSTRAVSWAAGLPWLVLHQAARRRGLRARSRGLLSAALAARRIRA